MHLRHKWSLTAVQKGIHKMQDGWVAGHFTWLLYQCDVCPKCKVEQVNGHWSKEDIMGAKEKENDA